MCRIGANSAYQALLVSFILLPILLVPFPRFSGRGWNKFDYNARSLGVNEGLDIQEVGLGRFFGCHRLPGYNSQIFDGSASGKSQNYSLQKPDEYKPCCEVSDSLLYFYCFLFLGLLFAGFVIGGVFLFDRHRLITGSLIFLIGICGLLSTQTTFLFCDPIFWRAEWLGLSGTGDPSRCQHHDQGDISQGWKHKEAVMIPKASRERLA